MSLFRISKPLLRPQAINTLRHPKMTSTFFQPSNPTLGLRHGTSIFSSLERFVPRRFYNNGAYGNPHEGTKSKILYGILGINAGVFIYYQYLREQAKQTGDRRPFAKFIQNMTLSVNNFVYEKRYWTMLTSTITHFEPWHLIANCISFYYMGSLFVATPTIAPAGLLTLIVGSGIAGSVGYLYNRYQKQQQSGRRDYHSAIGFSGAVSGVATAATLMYPKLKVAFMVIIPMPLWVLTAAFIFYDGYLVQREGTGIAHAGHLGGTAFGALYWLLKIRRMAW